MPLWTERGVLYAEVRSQLMLRGNAECECAAQMLRDSGFLVPGLEQKMTLLAQAHLDTVALLDKVEPLMRRALVDQGVNLTPRLDHFLELQALAVEHFVRQARGAAPNS